ncbi:hypothetical protein [Clavibacter michiganensis]|nr:hypothetical protein [Clavibacter michiganensis]AWF98940.1 hypothetical protein BEH61_10535 [Clavibacter michiganensis subsp. insidiosus]AWG00838.1 hypothetical protein BEH62_04410 [Clavibacter michiganensis subsp. insidiosus]
MRARTLGSTRPGVDAGAGSGSDDPEGIRMWSKQSGDATGAISPVPEHPHAYPVRGAWLVRVGDGPALGWVLRHRDDLAAPFTFEVYACGLGSDGLRVWVQRRESLNAAVAWVMQHDAELLAFGRRLRPDPAQPADRADADAGAPVAGDGGVGPA